MSRKIFPDAEMVGRRFGALVVLARSETVNGGVLWLCKCDCGAQLKARGPNLRRGATRSCGNKQFHPPKHKEDLTGRVFGSLVVVSCLRTAKGKRWQCRCVCGKLTAVSANSLLSGHSETCGCSRTTHGQTKTPTYSVWRGMWGRCRDTEQPNYGGRGIRVCARWSRFENFLKDMGERPSPDFTIERLNPNGDYTPENCKWLLGTLQNRNKRTTKYATVGGVKKTVSEWAETSGLRHGLLLRRLEDGWPESKLLDPPTPQEEITRRAHLGRWKKIRTATIQGITKTVAEWAESSGLAFHVIASRMRLGWPSSRLLEPVKANSARQQGVRRDQYKHGGAVK